MAREEKNSEVIEKRRAQAAFSETIFRNAAARLQNLWKSMLSVVNSKDKSKIDVMTRAIGVTCSRQYAMMQGALPILAQKEQIMMNIANNDVVGISP